MKTFVVACCFFAVISTVYGLPYANEQQDVTERQHVMEQLSEEKDLLTKLITRMMATTQQDNINAEILALKFAAIQAVAKAAEADPCFIRNCPLGGKWLNLQNIIIVQHLKDSV